MDTLMPACCLEDFDYQDVATQCIKDFHLSLLDVKPQITHASLQAYSDLESPAPDTLQVTIYDASSGNKVPFFLKSTDTIGKLKMMYLKMRPELGSRLNLAFNGKPVLDLKTLGDLGVKTTATFITFQKCHGG